MHAAKGNKLTGCKGQFHYGLQPQTMEQGMYLVYGNYVVTKIHLDHLAFVLFVYVSNFRFYFDTEASHCRDMELVHLV